MLTGANNMDFYITVTMPVLKPNPTVAGFSWGPYIGHKKRSSHGPVDVMRLDSDQNHLEVAKVKNFIHLQ